MESEAASPVLDAAGLRRVIAGFHGGLAAHRQVLDNLNVYPVPDGDTGMNMSLTLQSVLESSEAVADEFEPLCAAISHGALMGARGNSGVILAQILRGVCGVLRQHARADAAVMAAALTAASESAYSAVARPVEGTILTVVREAAEASAGAACRGDSLVEVLAAARERGYDALARTPEMLPALAAAGVVDAGGAGLVLLFDACLNVLDGRPMPQAPEPPPSQAAAAAVSAASGAGDSSEGPSIADLRYEVMFLLDAPDSAVDGFKSAWKEIGDSIVVVGGDGIWNCHIHTDFIGAAIEAGIAVGRPHRIEITDLLEQAGEHTERFDEMQTNIGAADEAAVAVSQAADSQAGAAAFEPVEITEADGCSVVAVGAGAGVVEILSSLGARRVVTGGQSMNPSTAELLAAVDSLPTGSVVVLPNNKNIIPVAEQLDGETLRNVGVVPTRSVVEGLAALVAFNGAAAIERNLADMTAAAGCVTRGEVTRAVREASSAAGAIVAGDWLGIGPEGIVAVASDMTAAALTLLDAVVTDDHELLTVIVGDGADAAATAAIVDHMAENHGEVEVEVSEGGQPLYPYYFGLE